MNRQELAKGASELGTDLTPEQLDQFEAYEENLYESNKVMNLTRVPREECWLRHFVDSLLLSPLIPEGAKVLDIGTGPGLPAWPLACARPDIHVTALDSSGKMIGFLTKHALPNLKPVNDRAETWGRREAFDFVTGRAVAPLGIQLELSAPATKVGGLVVLMRTPNDAHAIKTFPPEELGLRLKEVREASLPGTDVVRLFPIFEKVAKTVRQYPRQWAEIKRDPLG
jgi:16S rRNA (guanine527-N7)-methyltransferase